MRFFANRRSGVSAYVEDRANEIIKRRDAILDILEKARDLAYQQDTEAKDWFADKVCTQVDDIMSDLMEMDEYEAADRIDTSDYDDGYADYLYETRRDEEARC